MKKIRLLCLTLMMILLIFMLMPLVPDKTELNQEYQFTFVCPLTWDIVAYGIKRADMEENTYTKLVGHTFNDDAQMAEDILEAVYSGVDGIITAGVNGSEKISSALQVAGEKQVPVVLIDNNVEDVQKICYIGLQNYQGGTLAAENMIEATGGMATIGIVVSDMTNLNQIERVKGFRDTIADYLNMKVVDLVECYSNQMIVLEKVNKMLEKHPDMNALFLAEGGSSDRLGEEVKDYSDKTLTIVAFDGNVVLDYVKTGIYHSAIVGDYSEIGFMAVKNLVSYLNGEDVQKNQYGSMYNADNNTAEKIDSIVSVWKGKKFEWHMK